MKKTFKQSTNTAKHNLTTASMTTKAPQKKKPRHKGTSSSPLTKPPDAPSQKAMTTQATDTTSKIHEHGQGLPSGSGDSPHKRKQVQLTLDGKPSNSKKSPKSDHSTTKLQQGTTQSTPSSTPKATAVPPTSTTNPYRTAALKGSKVTTPPGGILKPTPQPNTKSFRERFDIKFKLDNNATNPTVALRNRITDWLEAAQSYAPSLHILPWQKQSTNPTISSSADVPEKLKDLKVYFAQATPRLRGKHEVWAQVHLTADEDLADLLSNRQAEMSWWYEDTAEALYLRPLRDAERTRDLGVMAYSSNFTDVKSTMEVINTALRTNGYKFELGGRLRVNNNNYKITDKDKAKHQENGGEWRNQYWIMLFLQCEPIHTQQAVRALYRLFNSRDTPQPGFLNMRFIPKQGTITMGRSTTDKINSMYGKHQSVVSALQSISVDTVVALDQPGSSDPALPDETLRTYLLQLRHSTTNRKLYHSVDWSTSYQDTGTNAVVLMTFPEHYSEAAAIASVLPALCDQKLGTHTNKWFTSEAQEICADVEFLPNSLEFKTPDETLFSAMLTEDFGTAAQVEFEGLQVVTDQDTAATARRKPRSDDSFHSFATITGGKAQRQGSTKTDTASGSISSPTMSQDISSLQSDPQAATVTQLREQNAGIQSENERLKAELAALTLSVVSKGHSSSQSLAPETSGKATLEAIEPQTDDDGFPSDRSLQDESNSDTSTGGVIDLQASSSTSISSADTQTSSQTAKSKSKTSKSGSAIQPSQSTVGSSSTGGDQSSL